MAEISEPEAALVGKALGDATRLGIYSQIASRKEVFCGELSACRLLSLATVSHHLRVLSRAGLISSRRSGQFIFYHAIKGRLADYRGYLSQFGKRSERTKRKRNS